MKEPVFDEPVELLTRPHHYNSSYMEQLTFLKPCRKGCTWVTDQNVNLYSIVQSCRKFYLQQTKEIPELMLSVACNPTRNDPDQGRNAIARMEFHARMMAHYRHGEVPLSETIEMKESTQILFAAMMEINDDPSLQSALDAFNDYVAVWDYTGISKYTPHEFQTNLKDKCNAYISSLRLVWQSFKRIEDRLSGNPTQLEFNDLKDTESNLAKLGKATIKAINARNAEGLDIIGPRTEACKRQVMAVIRQLAKAKDAEEEMYTACKDTFCAAKDGYNDWRSLYTWCSRNKTKILAWVDTYRLYR